jgi:drug/metabolite transporter (DMT)-like permease
MEAPARTTADDHRSKLTGRLIMVLAAVLWSTSGLFVKCGAFEVWDAGDRGPLLAFWRAVFAAAVLLPMVRRPCWRWELVPLTAIFAVMNVTFLSALALTTAANAIWLQSMAPFWVFFISVTVLRQRVVARELIPLAFAVVGIGTILAGEFFWIEVPAPVGIACGVASGVFYAAVVMLMNRLGREDSCWLVGLSHVVAAAVLVPVVLRLGVWPTAGQFAVLAAFGALQMAVPYVLLIKALRRIGSLEAVAIGLLEPVLNPLWVLLFTSERPAWWTAVGATLILAGLLLRYVVLPSLRAGRPGPARMAPPEGPDSAADGAA